MDAALTHACNWLVLHPRIACAAIVAFCILCGQVDWIAP